ncbi:hypothetical protein MHU86_17113 [Fragilaria crotonensis]|nr:hypothetical protein MHU86_17113 [Fragilaria crotonensis]
MLELQRHLALLLALLSHVHSSDWRWSLHCSATDGNCASAKNEEILGRATNDSSNDPTSCGIWFAKSTIPNSGLGMYAGRSFNEGEDMMASGDILIPIVDLEMHQGDDWFFVLDTYSWGIRGRENDGLNEVHFLSPGFGAAANSFLDLHNVEELKIDHSLVGVHRSKDPGAGAFTPYHNRRSIAKVPIPAGQELFTHIGDFWFHQRAHNLGPIPTTGDLPKANALLTKWDTLRRQHEGRYDAALKDLWETFVWTSPYSDTSRQFFALPKNWEETEQVLQMGLVNFRKQQSTRSLEWLQEHGICADNLREGVSEIPQAGRGAFATRFLKRGAIVAPLPLIHVPSRERLEMFQPDFSVENVVNKTKAVGQQLLVNYCFGHRHSTMLLCPYGLLTGLINHARTPNVKLQWSDSRRSSHAPEWLNKTIEEFAKHKFAVLSMELVALRDIEPDEEVVLDYGEEWEAAWDAHVASWSPVEGAASYVSSSELNEGNETRILRADYQQFSKPYPKTVHIRFDLAFAKENWKADWESGALLNHTLAWDADVAQCTVLSVRRDNDGNTLQHCVLDGRTEKEREGPGSPSRGLRVQR